MFIYFKHNRRGKAGKKRGHSFFVPQLLVYSVEADKISWMTVSALAENLIEGKLSHSTLRITQRLQILP